MSDTQQEIQEATSNEEQMSLARGFAAQAAKKRPACLGCENVSGSRCPLFNALVEATGLSEATMSQALQEAQAGRELQPCENDPDAQSGSAIVLIDSTEADAPAEEVHHNGNMA